VHDLPNAGELPDWPPGTVAVLATVGAGPHAVPVSTAVRVGERRVLLALARSRGSLSRLRGNPHVALAVLGEGDVACTLHGRARVLEEELEGAEGVAAVLLEVEHVQDHRRAEFRIDAGVSWRWLDEAAERRDAAVRAALAALSQQH
jgi:hypothetical protein